MTGNRGTGVLLQRSLRLRVVLATALAFVGLGIIVCLVLPRAYSEQARESLRERTVHLSQGVAFLLADDVLSAEDPAAALQSVAGVLDSDPDFESVVLLAPDGNVAARWPADDEGWSAVAPRTVTVSDTGTHYLAVAPVGNSRTVAAVAIRTSKARLSADLANVGWLFAAIFVFTCMAFWLLATYLSRGIVDPLEEIRQAAVSLADGEPLVTVPISGDRELDEIGRSIHHLGRARRASTVMTNPLMSYLQENAPQTRD